LAAEAVVELLELEMYLEISKDLLARTVMMVKTELMARTARMAQRSLMTF
jgi:hypothetical protein